MNYFRKIFCNDNDKPDYVTITKIIATSDTKSFSEVQDDKGARYLMANRDINRGDRGSGDMQKGDLKKWDSTYETLVYGEFGKSNPSPGVLKHTKNEIDKVYTERNYGIQLAAKYAILAGYKAGIRHGTQNDDWPVIAMELPNGEEVAWHIPKHEILLNKCDSYQNPWDGHSTEEKHQRIHDFCLNHMS